MMMQYGKNKTSPSVQFTPKTPTPKDVEWYKFWHHKSGIIGGIVFSALITLIFVLFLRIYLSL